MKIKLIGGSQNGKVMITPDDTLMLVFPRIEKIPNKPGEEIKYEKYQVSGYGFGLLIRE